MNTFVYMLSDMLADNQVILREFGVGFSIASAIQRAAYPQRLVLGPSAPKYMLSQPVERNGTVRQILRNFNGI